MEQTELYQEFERVIVDPEHYQRESEEEREEERRVSSGGTELQADSAPASSHSYVLRVLKLIRKPHEQWDRADYAFAAQVVEDTHYRKGAATEHEARDAERTETANRPHKFPRDEFDRRLWGLPPRPHLSRQ